MVLREPTLGVLKHELRQHICRQCRWRPTGSETLSADVARACEAGCSVFRHLPALTRTARMLDPMLRPPAVTLHHRVVELCRDDSAGTCPLRHYREQVARVLADAFDR
jgi:hypothetical protein